MRIKRLVAIILTLVIAFSLFACSNSEYDEQRAEQYNYIPHISETMPQIFINTESGNNNFATVPTRETKLTQIIEYENATISVSNCESEYELADVEAEVKARGNYTLDYAKKSIRIKFNKKNAMLGLNNGEKYKSWVLLAEWKDISLLNNATSFYLGKTILGSDGYYSADYRFVELYLNNQYWGVYLLTEQQQTGESRVNIAEPESDYTGTDIGYLIEYDIYYVNEKPELGGDPTFTMNYSFEQKGYTLKSDIYSDEQVEFIRSYMNNAYKIVSEAVKNGKFYKFNDTYTDIISAEYPSMQEAVASVIDIQSLVDTYVMQEIACDPDIGWSSFYMDVDMSESGSKKLVFEAPWDFDSAFGIRTGYMTNAKGMYASKSNNPWLVLLVKEDWFIDMVKAKWAELIRYDVTKKSIEYIDIYVQNYTNNFIKNHTKWEARLLFGNMEITQTLNSYKNKNTAQKLAAERLSKWLTTRYEYLAEQWKA